ncbi:MAG TPA: shikimate kinase, partial [Rhodospirillaceae bacterium]|nr:shikimate kinase [Rhodospirillaceae bacterium]
LIGMPGAGKSTIGRRLAATLGLPFTDSDTEIEAAAGMSVSQIFETLGEPAFREGERKVIARLLQEERRVLSTGGGAFMNETTRTLIKKDGISIWLKADLDILLERTSRTDDRPLLKKGDPKTILQNLMASREPVYALADVTVQTDDRPIDSTIENILAALENYLTRS